MLEKILAILLGILGVTTTTLNFPVRPVPTETKTATVATEKTGSEQIKDIQTANATRLKSNTANPKTTTGTNTENIKNTNGNSDDFILVRSLNATPKPQVTATAKVATTSPIKMAAQKPSAKPEIKLPVTVPPVTPEGSRTGTTFSTTSAQLSTLNLKLKTETTLIDWDTINKMARDSIVNVICTSQSGGSFEPLSGSGIIIDPRGIILTNAHIAQYFLLEDYRMKKFLNCVARTGSPATPKYTLKLLYISKQWLQDNYKIISSQKPTGTGENDYAFLQITGSTNPDIKLPTTFKAMALENNEDNIDTGDQVLLASYPAGFLGGIAIQRDLYIVSTIVNIKKLYTFKDGSLDAFGLGGSPVAQRGSSGGATVSHSGKLLGIIVTSTDAADTSKRDLDAISISHINRSLSTEIHLTLDSLFASDIETFSKTFDEKTLPNLKKLIVDELDSINR